jgi:hypothetical protein
VDFVLGGGDVVMSLRNSGVGVVFERGYCYVDIELNVEFYDYLDVTAVFLFLWHDCGLANGQFSRCDREVMNDHNEPMVVIQLCLQQASRYLVITKFAKNVCRRVA